MSYAEDNTLLIGNKDLEDVFYENKNEKKIRVNVKY